MLTHPTNLYFIVLAMFLDLDLGLWQGPAVTVAGAPEELLLFATGRTARVDYDGDESAVQAVRNAPKGL